MTVFGIYRDQGVTGPAVAARLLVGGSPLALASQNSVSLVVAGTQGSGITASYVTYVLSATWAAASGMSEGYVFAGLDPSSIASGGASLGWPCALPGQLSAEWRAIAPGAHLSWPSREPIPFIVRARTGA